MIKIIQAPYNMVYAVEAILVSDATRMQKVKIIKLLFEEFSLQDAVEVVEGATKIVSEITAINLERGIVVL